MQAAEWEVIEAYVEVLREQLRLRDWIVKIQREQPNDANSEAQTYILNDADEAHVRLNDRFGEWEPERQRAVLVHELLHLHLDRLHDLAEQALRGAAPAVWTGLEENHRRAYERAIERLAQAISPLMPPLEWPK